MRAQILEKNVSLKECQAPLKEVEIADPVPQSHEILIRVLTCGVCHTELDEIEGRTPPSEFPMVLGHQVVGKIIAMGSGCAIFKPGQRVGVGWFYSSCGQCEFCKAGLENLCANYRATGQDAFGGYAEKITVPETSAFLIPDIFSDAEAAPLLCAGAIGYRSLNLCHLKDGQVLGLTGFGASGHLVLKMARYQFPNSPIQVFARSKQEQAFALELGAVWAGDTCDKSKFTNHAIIDTTPVWKPVVEALTQLRPGGRLVINAIRKESMDQDCLLKLNYPDHLWMEKEIKSVANVAPGDIRGFLELAAKIPIKPEIELYPFSKANQALLDLKEGKIRGAKVLQIS